MAGDSAEPQQNELSRRRNASPAPAPPPPPPPQSSPISTAPSSAPPSDVAASSSSSATPQRSTLHIPEAYRSRLIIACITILLAIAVRLALGRRPPLGWLIRGFRYERNDGDGGSFSLFVSPFPFWVFLVRFVQFMLRRPQPRPRTQRTPG